MNKQLLSALTIATTLAACGEHELVPEPTIFVQGAAIDGSEDVRQEAPAKVSVTPASNTAAAVKEPATNSSPPDDDGLRMEDAVAEDATAQASSLATVTKPEVEAPPEVAVPKEPKGPMRLSYKDLSLIEYDVDAMLDYMLFPDEYKDEDTSFLELPKHLKALDGKEISLVGYMIPGKMDKGDVRDFMLVRDLMGCCFGGVPMPDEWLDVVMDEGAKAEYRPYMPMRVQGIMTLGGEQDEAGFALGIYRLQASAVQVED